MQKKIILLVLLGLLLTSLTGCATDKKKVVYTVYPLGYLLEKIGGDRIEIQSLQDEVIVQRASAAADLKERVKDADLVLHIRVSSNRIFSWCCRKSDFIQLGCREGSVGQQFNLFF